MKVDLTIKKSKWFSSLIFRHVNVLILCLISLVISYIPKTMMSFSGEMFIIIALVVPIIVKSMLKAVRNQVDFYLIVDEDREKEIGAIVRYIITCSFICSLLFLVILILIYSSVTIFKNSLYVYMAALVGVIAYLIFNLCNIMTLFGNYISDKEIVN